MSKTTTCLLWLWPPQIWTKMDQKFLEDNRVIFAWLRFPCRKTLVLATSENFSSKNLFKETTCLIWPLNNGPQGGLIRQVWLYSKISFEMFLMHFAAHLWRTILILFNYKRGMLKIIKVILLNHYFQVWRYLETIKWFYYYFW